MKKFILCLAALCICVGILGISARADEEKDYKIMVNRAANCVTVYEKDEAGEYTVPVIAFVCSCGREGHETPLGTYATSDYYEWRLMVDGSYGRYAVRFNKGIMFHSVPYYSQDAGDMEWEQYNLLGEAASLGCVRLSCADAKWIYDNCKAGTEVEVYDDAENPGPLGKPTEVKITENNAFKTWDPTDMGEDNPWNTVRPQLYLLDDRGDGVVYMRAGSNEEDFYNVLALRSAQGVAYGGGTYSLDVLGDYDLNTAGVYTIHVRGKDFMGLRVEQDMVLCVW